MSINQNHKQDGFPDESYFIIPTESFANYAEHPLIAGLYLTDVGFYPKAVNHYMEREDGSDEHILFYCVAGSGTIWIENKEYAINKDMAFYMPPKKRQRYYASKDDPWSIFWVHFKGENIKYFPLEEGGVVHVASRHASNRVASLFNLLFHTLECDYTQENFIYISQVLSLILTELYFRKSDTEVSTPNKHITAVVRYMYKHIKENITLDDISEEFNLSRSYLNAIFKGSANRSPIAFFINLKMQEACKMFKSTNMYINQVSAELGYTDPYYFSRIFKKVIGVSPKDYKNGQYMSPIH